MSTEVKKAKHEFSTDRPIESFEEDLLSRKTFSEKIANTVARWKEKDSLVLAIYGDWGTGKTSAKNLMLRTFENKKNNTQVIEFNPWHWKDEEFITKAFYREIGAKIKLADNGAEYAKVAAAKWERYSAYLEYSDVLLKKDGPLISSIITIAAILGLSFNSEIFAKVILALGALHTFLLNISKPIINIFKNKIQQNDKSLLELKNDLKTELKKFQNPIVVIIDDVDRLTKLEVKALMQTIKVNADFPNLIYILFFQRDIVEKCVSEDGIYNGADYLEKIIQVGFNLPNIDGGEITSILFSKVKEIVETNNLSDRFEQGRWTAIFNKGLRHYFDNLRDVNRFVSSFSFHVDMHKDESAFNVNMADLITIEVIRQFEPTVYSAILENKDIFTSGTPEKYTRPEIEKTLEAILSGAKKRSAIKGIFDETFPNLKWFFSSNYVTSIHDTYERDLRVCHPTIFDRYFQLSIAKGDLPQRYIDEALAKVQSEKDFTDFMLDLNSKGLLSAFLNRFEAHKQTILTAHAVPFITSFMNVSDLFKTEDFFNSDLLHAKRIVRWFMNQERDKKKRQPWVLEAIDKTTGILLPLEWIRDELTGSRKEHPELYDFDTSETEPLKAAGTKIIQNLIKSDDIIDYEHFNKLLLTWSYVSPDELKTWVLSKIETRKFFFDFLEHLVSHSVRSSGYDVTESFYFNKPYIERFVSVEKLYELRDKYLTEVDLSDDETKILTLIAEMQQQKPESLDEL